MSLTVEYTRQALGLHLFFARIMKEHAFFLKLGFTPRDSNFAETAEEFKIAFEEILRDAVVLSDEVVGSEYLESGEVVTPFTLKAEKASEFFTGVGLDTQITKLEENLAAGRRADIDNATIHRVYALNNRAMDLLEKFIQFKARILRDVLACKMFTVNYPLLIDHILREAKLYYQTIQKLQDKESTHPYQEALEQEIFWNRIMAEHSLFIRGLLDPTENDLIAAANNFGNEFNQLYEESKAVLDRTLPLTGITEDSLRATLDVRNFNAQGTQGILECKVRSIIIPLLGDHVLRESNHFIHLLRRYSDIR